MNNWTSIETPRHLRKEAEKTLEKLNESRKGKKFKYIKVNDRPLTYNEVEIKTK